MPAGIIQRSDYPLFMTPMGVKMLQRKHFDTLENLLPEMKQMYFDIKKTDNAYEMSYGRVGMGRLRRKPETVAPRFDKPGMGRPFVWVFPTYALGVAISREAQEDDKDNELVPMITKELKRSVIETQEEDAVSQLNNAFDYQGWESDGVSIANVAHPLLKADRNGNLTYSNRHPTDAVLSITSLDAAFTQLQLTPDDTGRPMANLKPKYLDVAPGLDRYALQIVQTAKVLGSNFNDTNLYYNQLEVRVNPRLSPLHWMVSADMSMTSDVWWNRRMPDMETEIDTIAGVTMLLITARWGRGQDDPRGRFYSKGGA